MHCQPVQRDTSQPDNGTTMQISSGKNYATTCVCACACMHARMHMCVCVPSCLQLFH